MFLGCFARCSTGQRRGVVIDLTVYELVSSSSASSAVCAQASALRITGIADNIGVQGLVVIL
jgi:hypothetical protein